MGRLVQVRPCKEILGYVKPGYIRLVQVSPGYATLGQVRSG
jgi:hypothetical protein